MYCDTPYKSYGDVQKALRSKTATLRIARGSYAKLFTNYCQGRLSVVLAFLLQLLLPIAFVIGWYFYCKQPVVLWAMLFYLVLPFILPLNSFISTAMTAFGLFGLIWGWPPLAVAALLPGILSYLGNWIWQQSILLVVCRRALNGRLGFEELWEHKLIALQDKEGIYSHEPEGGNDA